MVTTTDRAGRITAYTDASGVATTTAYDAAGRVVGETSTAPGGGSSVTGYAYNDASQVSAVSLDGQQVAAAVIDAGSGEVSGASYGNGSTGAVGRNSAGALVSASWSLGGGHAVTNTVTRSLSGRVTADVLTDGADPVAGYGWSYGYDAADRLLRHTSSGGSTAYAYDPGGMSPPPPVRMAG